jgi:hypothetical protein
VPRWHVASQQWVRDGRVVLLGIAQEHHADRCRLFAQWKGFDWPILHDPINVIGPKGVPFVVAIDESGVVRAVKPNLEDVESQFIDKTFPADDKISRPEPPVVPDIDALQTVARKAKTAESWRGLGDALALWQAPARLGEAIAAYSHALELDDADGSSMFRLGVCYSMRNESDGRRSGDFQRAVDKWSEALATDPSHYIWRRRIQQYGPQSDKPYPFYSWTDEAASEIRSRGDEPIVLRTAPTGSETAQPVKQLTAASATAVSPDSEGLINRDPAKFVDIEVTVVPPRISPGGDGRVHVEFRPSTEQKAHWNNEAEPLRVWVDPPDGWKTTDRLMAAPQPAEIESNEVRHLDFGIQIPQDARSTSIRAYAMYYICEDVQGTCRFLRQDFSIDVVAGR